MTLRRVMLAAAPSAKTARRHAQPSRNLRGRSVVAAVPRETAPAWAYLPARPKTIASAAIRKALAVGARARRAGLVNFMFKRVNQRRGRVAPTLTATASSDWHLRDERGVRIAVAVEVGALHGYPRRILDAMLAAARARRRGPKVMVATLADAEVRRAVGDGFMLPVITDMIYRMVRARLRASGGAVEGGRQKRARAG